MLAALGPRMLGLARDRAAGVHPYFVPPEHVARGARDAEPDVDDRRSSSRWCSTPTRRPRAATARQHTGVYVNLPNYTNNLRRFGYGDDDFADGGATSLSTASSRGATWMRS